MRLMIIGCGYSSEYFVRHAGHRYHAITGTVRNADKAARLSRDGFGGAAITAHPFDGTSISKPLAAALAEADHLLVSAPPAAEGDPLLTAISAASLSLPPSVMVAYLSTVGVYGDHGGGWVDETTEPRPRSTRSVWRLNAEQQWQRSGVPVAILRLAGIYGPGQNALINLRAGTARRIIKPGQVFNRIHVADIARAIDAVLQSRRAGVFNVTDDEPCPPQDVVAFAADLLGMERPPDIPFEDAELSPMGRSFYGENKRVSNVKLRQQLNVNLAYPDYRVALTALLAAGDGQDD